MKYPDMNCIDCGRSRKLIETGITIFHKRKRRCVYLCDDCLTGGKDLSSDARRKRVKRAVNGKMLKAFEALP